MSSWLVVNPQGNIQNTAQQIFTVMKYEEFFSCWRRNLPSHGQSHHSHYSDVIMGAVASQITSFTIVCSTVYSGADQRGRQSSTSLAFVWGINHNSPVNSPHKWPVTRKMIPFDDVIMQHFCIASCHDSNISWNTVLHYRFTLWKNSRNIFSARDSVILFVAMFVTSRANQLIKH